MPSPTLTTPNLSLAESGNQYRALVRVDCNGSSATSAVATVTLTAPVQTPLSIVMCDTFLDPTSGLMTEAIRRLEQQLHLVPGRDGKPDGV